MRNQLGALLYNYNADIMSDIVFGGESHIDQSFSSSEILPKNYKVIRKIAPVEMVEYSMDLRKNHLNISEVSEFATYISLR